MSTIRADEPVVDLAQARRVGRPRREGVTDAILEAALSLVQEQGVEALTIDGIAARAGVSRPTLYSRWTSKEALVDATLGVLMDRMHVEQPHTGHVRDDLVEWA